MKTYRFLARFLALILVAAVLAAATLACSLFNRAAKVLEGASPSAGSGAESGGPGGGGSGSASAATSQPPGQISNLTEGLESLESYRAVFTLTVEGRDDQGNPAAGSIEMLHEVNRPAGQDHVRYAFNGVLAADTPLGTVDLFETFRDGEMTYILSDTAGDRDCAAYPSGEGAGLASVIISAEDLVAGVQNPRLEKRDDTYEGIQADRYSFKDASFYFGSLKRVSGKYWLAAEGGYVVQFNAQASGKGAVFGTAVDGNYTLTYAVSGINAGGKITLPAECASRQVPADLPIPPDAFGASNFSGTVSFETRLSPVEAAAFFRENMPARGWAAGEEKTVQDMILLAYTKEGRSLAVMITPGGSGSTSVLITPSE